jgi:hypothetical protein
LSQAGDALSRRSRATIRRDIPEELRRAERGTRLAQWRYEERRAVIYSLWDSRTTNLVAAFDNERDALAFVLGGIERNGPHDTDTLTLEVEDEQGELVHTMRGQELAERARREMQPARLLG